MQKWTGTKKSPKSQQADFYISNYLEKYVFPSNCNEEFFVLDVIKFRYRTKVLNNEGVQGMSDPPLRDTGYLNFQNPKQLVLF
jgi:hypothetical protein